MRLDSNQQQLCLLLTLLMYLGIGPVQCYESFVPYKQQVVLVLENKAALHEVGGFLYQKHDTSSHVLAWNETLRQLQPVKWNADLKTFELSDPTQELPIGLQKPFSWSETVVKVIGSNATDNAATLSGVSAEDLATLITLGLADGDEVGHIGIITFAPLDHPSDAARPPVFMQSFMEVLKKHEKYTGVTFQSNVAAVDHSGRGLTGELVVGVNHTGVQWRHGTHSHAWKGSFVSGQYRLQLANISAVDLSLNSPYFGIVPEGDSVCVTDFQPTSNQPPVYAVTDARAFNWVDKIAQRMYAAIPAGRAPSITREVLFLSHETKAELSVIEVQNITDLLKELHYYGEYGPSDDNDSAVYYRFGDWVVSMNEADFSVSVVGVLLDVINSSATKTAQLADILEQWHTIPDFYPGMQSRTGNNFFRAVSAWINGSNADIQFNIESAFNAQCGLAMYLSDSIRCFHIHVTNMMSLDLAGYGYLTKQYFFASHPLALEDTWQEVISETWKKKTGLNFLQGIQSVNGSISKEYMQFVLNVVVQGIAKISQSWLSHVESATVMGSRDIPPATVLQNVTFKEDLLHSFENIGLTVPHSSKFLRSFELNESLHRLLSPITSLPEIGAVDRLMKDFSYIDVATLPLQASLALINDHAYVSDILGQELHFKELQTGKKYQIVPNTVVVDDESDIVHFYVQEIGNISSTLEELTTNLVKSHLQSKALLKKIFSLSNSTKFLDDWLTKGDKLVSAVTGISSAIEKLESGNLIEVLSGAFSLGKNVYEIGDTTGINKAAQEFLGKALKPSSEKVTKSVIGEVTSIVKKTKNEVESLMGEIKVIEKALGPVIKAIKGIYSIYQDFKQGTTLGYINGALDIASTVAAFIPGAGEVEAVLSLVKMGVDYFYADISKEIHALPPHASVVRIVVAVLKGILDGIVDIIQDVIHNLDPFAVIGDAHKLDRQYQQDQELLEKMSDYKNYYKILKGNGSDPSEINFAGGEESWNGGDITFHLGESGSSTLSLQAVTSGGQQINETHDINTEGVEDIILGIGESHSISFKKITIHFAWFIPVDSKTVISKVSGEKETLHGTYYGNSHNNKFIAVQELPPKTASQLGYNLYDYHYTLYGGGGNDSFYLGPQPTYVEGNEGSDAYFINSTSTFTEINTHAGDGQEDTMIINLSYAQLKAQRAGFHLNLTSSNTHRIVLRNWFQDVTHQRMIFKTGDGVLFRVSATITEEVELIAYALSGADYSHAISYDSRSPVYSEVITIAGSEYDDSLFGNDLDNQLNGAGGNDKLSGGEGKDTYTVDLGKGIDTINNFALDGQVDSLVIRTKLAELSFSSHEGSEDLYISHVLGGNSSHGSNTGAVIVNWFMNETYRHLIVVTEDQALIKLSSVKNTTVAFQSLILNMSDIEPKEVSGDPYTRKLNLNSNKGYAQILTVFGTEGNDSIIGNIKDNYLTGARGFDYLEGREGADTYIVKENDGSKIIMNCARDTNIDTLLYAAKFDDISLKNSSLDIIILSSAATNDIEVTLKNWFQGSTCQHMVVRSSDGVTFSLPNDTSSLNKVAQAIDNSNLTSDVQLILTGRWAGVERVIGSQGDDQIIGNSLDNYLDPGRGNSYLQGGNGSDTYVIRSTYGEENIINNYAEDELTDTVLFMVPFLTIQTEIIGMDVRLTSLSGDGLVGIRMVDYNFKLLDQARHLIFTTVDGISFVLPIATNGSSKPTPVAIDVSRVITGQHIHLTAYPDFSEVRSVFGSSGYQNTLIGNKQNNTLVGGVRNDLLQGGNGDDVIKGDKGNDIIDGESGADTLVGEDGDDTISGGEDNDLISPGKGSNRVDGGSGVDTVIYNGDNSEEAGINLDLSLGMCIHDGGLQDELVSIENAYGTEYDDDLVGDDKDNVLVGQGGDDYLSPGSGYDLLRGGNGNDTYNLTFANGTVIIENHASDQEQDTVIIDYADLPQVWYEIVGQDVVLRVINHRHPVFYDGGKPTVIFKDFLEDPEHQHVSIQTADGSVTELIEFISPKHPPSSNPSTGPATTNKPSKSLDAKAATGLYIALALILLVLFFFLSVFVFGVYKARSKAKKRYIQL